MITLQNVQLRYFKKSLIFFVNVPLFPDNAAVTIGHVDCTADGNTNRELCSAHGVNGFPTLNIYKDGQKADEYNGKRDLEDLVAFVEKQLAEPAAPAEAEAVEAEAKDEL